MKAKQQSTYFEKAIAEIGNFQYAWIVGLKCDPELVFNWVSVKDILEEVSVEIRYKRLAVILNS